MKNTVLLLLFLFAFTFHVSAQKTAITAAEIQEHINFLASDDLAGRYPGTPEDAAAAAYIRNQMSAAGVQLMGENGYQNFDLITDVALGRSNRLSIGADVYLVEEDFMPLPFTSNAALSAALVFVGYGFEIENDSIRWDDYAAADVSGKWAVVLRGAPAIEGWDGVFQGMVGERMKVLTARDKGAAGVIFVNGAEFDSDDQLLRLTYDKSSATAGIPVLQMKRSIIDNVMIPVADSVAVIERQIKEQKSPVVYKLPVSVSAMLEVQQKVATTHNVVGWLEGTNPALKDECVVIGAHYDHLGMGGPGSGSRAIDTVAVHNGADDNASGVAGLLELAQYFADRKNRPERSLLFIAFGAEEMGLIGSKYFVENPLIDLSKIMAMINLDMIGRLKDHRTLSVGGTGTSSRSEAILDDLAKASTLKMQYSKEGYGPSDHASFYGKDIPVFFITTGAHDDYHTPRDRAELINAEGEAEVVAFTADLAVALANNHERLVFMEAGPKERQRHGYNFKVTLGIMPDFAGSGNDGLRVDAVRPDGPAHAGGLLKGDKIVAIEGKPVGNIYDYMGRLKSLEAGQIITVDVMRADEKMVFLIPL
ncbi:MAG: M20/M25/M40 family metallo-hydrolase [Bacteroidales bacterium]|nr:M20/M25/M40 family metallo-hydrolase [Bacteroidales bacterium]